MLETNIRIVYPGKNLYVLVRDATVRGSTLSADLLEAACSKLRNRYGLAATKCMTDPPSLLVATSHPIPVIHLEDEEWELWIEDAGADARRLTLDSPLSNHLPLLIERALMVKLAQDTDLWRISDSTRLWYESNPFCTENGIDTYRRYRIAALSIGDQGVGVAVDPETAFFTANSLSYFFDLAISADEQGHRAELLDQLTKRQEGQKGTLLYDNSRTRTKCYFVEAPSGATCATTGIVRARGCSYSSLYEYYKTELPALEIEQGDQAVRVSFKHSSKPQWIASKQARVHVMNDSLPDSLASIDKIPPDQRRELVERFWNLLGNRPFGYVAPGLRRGFWRPGKDRICQLPIPNLVFGRDTVLSAPSDFSVGAYRDNYWQRAEFLDEVGCYYVPPDMPRTLYFACPSTISAEASDHLATDLTQAVHNWTTWAGCSVQPAKPIVYSSVPEAISKLRDVDSSGVVVFVLNEEPAAYYEVAFQLERWRVKRITEDTLCKFYKYLKEGRWNKRKRRLDQVLGRRHWESFISKNALGVLQLLEVIPYRLEETPEYEAQLFIDVGYDKKHFALSLLIARSNDKDPSFRIVSHTHVKPDTKHEAINPRILTDNMVNLFEETMRRTSDPLESLLVLRDGHFCTGEDKGVNDGLEILKDQGRILGQALVDFADLRKGSMKAVRLWDVDNSANVVENPLEGSAVQLNGRMVVVASTGVARLHQGTSNPYIIAGDSRCSEIMRMARAAFAATQLNWSSPTEAQRLPIQVKRADEDLKEKAAQEIKRYY